MLIFDFVTARSLHLSTLIESRNNFGVSRTKIYIVSVVPGVDLKFQRHLSFTLFTRFHLVIYISVYLLTELKPRKSR